VPLFLFLCGSATTWADASGTTNSVSIGSTLPDVGASAFRVVGALLLVMALLVGAAILFKNWQRFGLQAGRQSQLRVIEARSLGARNAIYVVGYQQQRLLLSSSPSGIALLSHLPAAETTEQDPVNPPLRPSFIEALQQVLRKNP
jgi:flagellar biogenesis protein FliO